ncbi:hypothetical protein SAMN04487891_101480 [Flagellimonas taeanensis]|uniref:Beta-lactamase-inhibitor-like, PepSY-like n=1 Tax=Flagellimonas taeanensis TaxID=1005926 RepID=A0A1M6Q8I6_9FLAO|nr:hypothetical protein [Allomuricauda taeanensis]SFB69517.1 hypothetical protein SAMN04487891_101480 [Allomuricauda taeanensis]SHK16468.1 hypothetical protein SAMN05216293_0487 [Allomuricauda taeanensis]
MKTTVLIIILLLAFSSCHSPQKGSNTQTEDKKAITAQLSQTTVPENSGQDTVSSQEEEYTETDDEGRIYNPYDFPLEVESIKALLGHDIVIDTKYFEDEYYPEGYTFTKITHKDTQIAFYDVLQGKHRAHITTPKLSVLGGIKIGAPKQEFLKAMHFRDANAEKFNIFNLMDEYGAMTFSFRKDTLFLIDGYYEEGD